MVTINLLPWRDKQAQHEKRVMQIIVISTMMGACLLLGMADQYVGHRQMLTTEHIADLKKEIAWRRGLAKANANTTSLTTNASRENWPVFFNQFNQMGNNVCFEQIKKNKESVELIGWADSTEKLTTFLQSSPVVAYFAEMKVKQLQPHEDNPLKFHLAGKWHAV